jgi:type II secretory pathway pseudopilin PulG
MKRGKIIEDKIGQFYLIAALVIIVMIIAVVAVYNYTRRQEDSRIQDLADQLKVESGKILDYGASSGSYPWDDFTKNFTDYAGSEVDVTYVTGLDSDPSAFYYDDNGNKQPAINYTQGSTLIVTHNNANYSFDLKEGQNFYFIISQYIGEEYYVARN